MNDTRTLGLNQMTDEELAVAHAEAVRLWISGFDAEARNHGREMAELIARCRRALYEEYQNREQQ